MTTTPEPIKNPYVGPRTFTREEGDRFFGREVEADDLVSLVIAKRLVIFYAQSGAGKSSLINTRLLPRLEKSGFGVLPVGRVSDELPEGIIEVDNIFTFNLMLSLDKGEGDPNRFNQLSLTNFLARLFTDDGKNFYYDDTLNIEAHVTTNPTFRYVLVIDQFEEIVTAHLEHWQQRTDFFRQLDQAMADDPALWVVLTLREDYIAALEPYAHLLADKIRARFYMQRMDYQAALDAVKKPAELGRRPFAKEAATILVDNLSQIQLPGQIEPQPGQFVEPVQLQVVCYQLWEKLKDKSDSEITQQDLDQYGDVNTALTEFYENALAKALQQTDWHEIELRRWFDQELITEAGTRGIVFQGAEQTAGLPNTLVKVLADQFLLRTELRAGGIWVELIHDRFVEPIRQANQRWETARLQRNPLMRAAQAWQAADYSKKKLLSGVQLREAEEYATTNPGDITLEEEQFLNDSQHLEKQQEAANQATKRRRIILLVTALVVIAVLFGLALWALGQADRATKAEIAAKEQAQITLSRQLAAQALNRLNNNPDLALLLSLESGRHDPEIPEFRNSLFSNIVSLPFLETILYLPGRSFEGVVFNHNGQLLATGGKDHNIYLWDVGRRQITGQPLTGHNSAITDIAFSPNGEFIVSSDNDGYVIFWDLATGRPAVSPKKAHMTASRSLTFSPDGDFLVSSGLDGEIIFWDVSSRQPDGAPLVGHEGPVWKTSFSPDGKRLASVGEDSQIILWDVKSRQQRKKLTGHQGAVTSVAFSQDGQLLATGGHDTNILLWDASPCCSLIGSAMEDHSGSVNEVAFSTDGKYLISVSEDSSIIL